jgi:hypothetical protein
MATAKKPSVKSKATVGSSKKSKGGMKLSMRAALYGLLIVLLISIVGGLGWQQWQDHHLKAKAAGWTTVLTLDNSYNINYYTASTGLFKLPSTGYFRYCIYARTSGPSGLAITLGSTLNTIINTTAITYCSPTIYGYQGNTWTGKVTAQSSVTLYAYNWVLQKVQTMY